MTECYLITTHPFSLWCTETFLWGRPEWQQHSTAMFFPWTLVQLLRRTVPLHQTALALVCLFMHSSSFFPFSLTTHLHWREKVIALQLYYPAGISICCWASEQWELLWVRSWRGQSTRGKCLPGTSLRNDPVLCDLLRIILPWPVWLSG